MPLHKGRSLNKMNLGSIYSTCFFGAVVIRGMNSNYKPKAFFNRRNLVSTCFFRVVVTAVKGDVEYIQSSFSPPKQFQGLVGWNCTNLFFAPFPNELEALSVIATLIRLKRFHAGNSAKSPGSLKKEATSSQNKPHNQTNTNPAGGSQVGVKQLPPLNHSYVRLPENSQYSCYRLILCQWGHP